MENIKNVGFDEFLAACDLRSERNYHVYDIYTPENYVENYIIREVVSKDEDVSVKEILTVTESDMFGIISEKVTSKGEVSFPKDKSAKLVVRETELTYEEALKGGKPTVREITYVYAPNKNVA